MTGRRLFIWLVSVIGGIAIVVILRSKLHFDMQLFWWEVRQADARRIGLATALIYTSVCLRGARWATLLKPVKRASSLSLIGPQFIGFTCVSLFGSLGDLVRPYLVAKTVKLPLSSQMATYTIERMFDLGAAALIFSATLLAAQGHAGTAHRQIFVHMGLASLAAVVLILCMAFAVRALGGKMADGIERALSGPAPKLGSSIAMKLRSFRDGLNVIHSFGDFLSVLAISLAIWSLVAAAYVQVVHAFVKIPQLATLSLSQTMLLVAANIGGSLVQFPVIGWFTQIAATGTTMHEVFGVPTEAATACGAVLLGVTFLFLIPAGLVFALFMRVSLGTVLTASEQVSE